MPTDTDENLAAIRAQLPGIPVGLLKRFVFNEAEPVFTVQSILEEIQTCNSVCNPGYTAMERTMAMPYLGQTAPFKKPLLIYFFSLVAVRITS